MASTSNIRRLNDDALEHQFTAKDLIGKELYDRSGKRIGEVKDVVLASSTNPQLAASLRMKDRGSSSHYSSSSDSSTSGSSTTRSATGSVGGVGASGSVSTSDNGVAATGSVGRSHSGDTSGISAATDMARRAGAMGAMSEDAVVVSYGGFLGAGNSLIRVPLSQLNFDATSKHFTINLAENELASLPESTESTRSAAE
jgi:hypothetical protein